MSMQIYHNISIYSQLPPVHMTLSKLGLERPRSPWEVHAEPLGLRGAQVGNLWSKGSVASYSLY